jgi:hypothetical protein
VRFAAHRGEDQVDARHAANLRAHDESCLRSGGTLSELSGRVPMLLP